MKVNKGYQFLPQQTYSHSEVLAILRSMAFTINQELSPARIQEDAIGMFDDDESVMVQIVTDAWLMIEPETLAFNYMIQKDLYTYSVSSWDGAPGEDHYKELRGRKLGQIDYKGEIFVLSKMPGNTGMSDSPEEMSIVRIIQSKELHKNE